MELRWLRRALRDLDSISAFIARDDPKAARELLLALREKVQRLSAYPYSGRASEQADVRELVVHEHYLVSYRIRMDRIEILQVWHARQDRSSH